jgi:hypothetical protein
VLKVSVSAERVKRGREIKAEEGIILGRRAFTTAADAALTG